MIRFSDAWLRDPYDGQEKSEFPYGVGKFLVFHRFGDIDIAAELIAFDDLVRIVRGGQDDDGYRLRALVVLDDAEDLVPVQFGEVQVQEDERGEGWVSAL